MEIREYPNLYIGGEWVKPHSDNVIESYDPSTGQVWATVPSADEVDVQNAVDAARVALKGPWRSVSATEKGEMLYRLSELILENIEYLSNLESKDNGKPIRDTRGEITRAAGWIRYFAGFADKVVGSTIPYRPNTSAYTRREPVGVVAAITPWNSPISMYSWKLGPALATGNAVILKPAEQTSVTAFEIAKLVEKAGFPAGVVNVIPGYGETAGRALVQNKGVNKISFTGEHRTALRIMKDSTSSFKRMSFECGGKSPHILFEDCDLERALTVATHSAFRSTGQSCSLGSRLFVLRQIYERAISRLKGRVAGIRVGMPLDEKTHIGPQTSKEQLEKTLRYIQLGKEAGAKLQIGGSRLEAPEFRNGYFVQPTIFSDVHNDWKVAQDEIFGPVLCIIPFDNEEEVLQMANDTIYGLVAGVWTKDIGKAHRMIENLESGLVSVNTYRPVYWNLPYGGVKMSGLGREHGYAVLNEYTEYKTVVIDYSPNEPKDPFAN